MIKVVQIVILLLFIVLGQIDRKKQEIPLMGILFFGAVCSFGGILRLQTGEITVYEMMFGAVIGLLLLLYGIFSKEQIGMGDGLLLMLLGIFCGRRVLLILWLASVLGCVKAVYLLISKKGNQKTKFAFVPILGVGYVVSFFL